MTNARGAIRILLIDDHAMFRESVSRVLALEYDFVVRHCASIAFGLEILIQTPVDLVLLDHDLGNERASQFLPAAREAGYIGKVLIVTAWISDTEARRLVRQGVAGVFLKERPLSELAETIRAVTRGEQYVDPRLLKEPAAAPRDEEHLQKLNERQRRVLRFLMEGLSNKEIGWRLGISESYAKSILQSLFRKTGVRTRGQLVRIALEYHSALTRGDEAAASAGSTIHDE